METKDYIRIVVLMILAALIGTVIGELAWNNVPTMSDAPQVDPLAQPIVYQTEEVADLGVIHEDLIVFEELTEADRDELIARVVEAEAGIEPFIGKVAVATVILNRMEARDMTAEQVIYEKNQFTTPSDKASDDSLRAVAFAKEARDLFPLNMLYFRRDYYHVFPNDPEKKKIRDYVQIGQHYFSLDKTLEVDE